MTTTTMSRRALPLASPPERRLGGSRSGALRLAFVLRQVLPARVVDFYAGVIPGGSVDHVEAHECYRWATSNRLGQNRTSWRWA
jgi:hypothetical protein